MSRIHPGKPPSQRNRHNRDWRENVRVTTRSLVKGVRETLELDGPATRQHIIQSVRYALNEASDPTIEKTLDRAELGKVEDDAVIMTAAAYRVLMVNSGLDRKNPTTAESFMTEVVTALDIDMGLGWRTKVQNVTRMMVTTLMETRNGDTQVIRSELLDAAKEALSDKPLDELSKLIERPDGPDLALSKAGVYRMILDCEEYVRQDMTPDAFMAAVAASLDAELAAAIS